jgi:hypothetical protein
LFEGTGFVEGRPQLLYRNNGNANHWLVVKPLGTVSPGTPVGAMIRVASVLSPNPNPTLQLRPISASGLFGACYGQGQVAHFGLGDATNVETLRIEWPSGITQEYVDLAVNQFLTVAELPVTITGPPEGVATNASPVTLQGPTDLVGATFQWWKDGEALPGATGAAYEIASLQTEDTGFYTLVVTVPDARLGTSTATSKPFQLSIGGPPVLGQPVSVQTPALLSVWCPARRRSPTNGSSTG